MWKTIPAECRPSLDFGQPPANRRVFSVPRVIDALITPVN
jgi:hypothetical protein